MEVAASENTHVRSGVVDIAWMKDVTIFDYDAQVFEVGVLYYQNYWPVKPVAVHLCCLPGVIGRYVVPIIHAVIDKWSRSRTRIHSVEANIVDTLQEYGIEKEMLPTMIGGTFELDPSEWIAQRRATEMEELS